MQTKIDRDIEIRLFEGSYVYVHCLHRSPMTIVSLKFPGSTTCFLRFITIDVKHFRDANKSNLLPKLLVDYQAVICHNLKPRIHHRPSHVLWEK